MRPRHEFERAVSHQPQATALKVCLLSWQQISTLEVEIKYPSTYEEVLTFVLAHVRRFKSDNENTSFKNHNL